MPEIALIIVDMQNDFLPGGALAVPDGDAVIPGIVELAERCHAEGHLVVLTRDWHPDNHVSFSTTPEFKDGSWPKHCVQNSVGAMIQHEIYASAQPHPGKPAPIFSKGTNPTKEAYSGFDGVNHNGVPLVDFLRENGVNEVYVVGLAADYCVDATALSLADEGFITAVVAGLTRPVTWETAAVAASLWDMNNVNTVTADEAMDLML